MEFEISIHHYCQMLYKRLLQDLDSKDHGDEQDGTLSTTMKIELTHTAIKQLKEKLLDLAFLPPVEEIVFMKKLLPDILSLMVYYSEIADLECTMPIASEKFRQELINRKLSRIELFLLDNTEYIRYYHSGDTHLDEYYFLRSRAQKHPTASVLNEWTDPSFCTVYSYKAATLLAYAKLETEIQQMKLNKPSPTRSPNGKIIQLQWTDSKSNLVELIYSLNEQGAFNYGKVDIKTISDHFGQCFSIELGNVSSAFNKMLFRKTGRTLYIDQLKNKLLKRIDEMESD